MSRLEFYPNSEDSNIFDDVAPHRDGERPDFESLHDRRVQEYKDLADQYDLDHPGIQNNPYRDVVEKAEAGLLSFEN